MPPAPQWPRLRDRQRRSFWPAGIRGRLLVIITVGVLAVQGTTGWLFERRHHRHQRWENPQVMTAAFAERVVAIAALLDSLPPNQQSQFIDTLSNALLQVQSLDQLPDQASQCIEDRRLGPLRSQLTTTLTTPALVQLCSGHRPDAGDDPVQLWPSRQQLVIALEKPDGGWWVFRTPFDFDTHGLNDHFKGHRPDRPPLFWLFLIGAVVWFFSAWAARRVTAPLLHFAAAADRLGMDVNAPPLPENGSGELRQAARAFNQMQVRVQGLIRDRTFMLAAISHDLRTVLTRLRLRTELIEDVTQQQKVAADLAQMEAMLVSTLAFAKADSTPEARTPLDLASLLQSICDDWVDTGRVAQYQGPDRGLIEGQPTALRRAFTNLIENATLYGQEVEVTLAVVPPEVTVAISDRGPGIPEEMREQVFEPFFRLEPSRNRDTGGTGLGLAVARTVIRRHGGGITLRSREGGGLVVEVTLPVRHP
jgi:signal transduction histidine kinase